MAWGLFRNLRGVWGGGSVLGVDIGTASIKAVELSSRGRGGWKLENYGILSNYGHFDRLNEVIQTSTMKIFDKEAAELLKVLVKKMGVRTKRVVASVPSFSAFVTLVEMPEMPEGEVGQAMQFKARQLVPLPIEEVTLDWLPVGQRTTLEGKVMQQVLLVSVPTEKIKQYKRIFKEAGLELEALEVEALASVRSLVRNDPTPTLILDIGSHSSMILTAQGANLKSSDQIDYAGSHLTHALSKGMNINLRRAEELKKQKGLTGTGGEFELSTIMFPFIDVILKEVMRVKERYENNYESKIERMILAGGGASLPGLSAYVEKQIGVAAVTGNPLLGVDYDRQLEPIARQLGSVLSVSLGLAMRE